MLCTGIFLGEVYVDGRDGPAIGSSARESIVFVVWTVSDDSAQVSAYRSCELTTIILLPEVYLHAAAEEDCELLMLSQIPTKVIHDTQVTILGGKESQARRDQIASVVLIIQAHDLPKVTIQLLIKDCTITEYQNE